MPVSCFFRVLVLFGALFSLSTPFSSALAESEPCLEQVVCPIGDRGYHVKLPDNWDGKSKMPVLLHFHGWKRQGTLIVKHRRIAGATAPSGVLLLAPNGLYGSWDFWDPETRDIEFARKVLADAARRWPIDESRIFVSGYSFGSAMAWRFACSDGARIAGLLAIAGTLPNQYEDCPTPPVHVRHVHGRKDKVMDFPFGPNGEETFPVTLWRLKDGCEGDRSPANIWRVTDRDEFTRYVWDECASGKSVILDVHERGHFIPVGWIQRQLDEIL